jgi:hypothetical protein
MTIATPSLGELPLADQTRATNDKKPPPKRLAIAKADPEAAPEPR